MLTLCPIHQSECITGEGPCDEWKKQRAQEAEALSHILVRAHRARLCSAPVNVVATDLSSPVPAVAEREQDPTLMIWAYAIALNRVLTTA